jgi:hypothetical protein
MHAPHRLVIQTHRRTAKSAKSGKPREVRTLYRRNNMVFMGTISCIFEREAKPGRKQDSSINDFSALFRCKIETIAYDSPASSPFATGVSGLTESTNAPEIRRHGRHAWQSEDTACCT